MAKPEVDRRGVSSAYIPHPRVMTLIEGPSLTRQEFADECDVNAIMERYERSGIWPVAPQRQPVYFDATEMPEDFRQAMDMMVAADEAFMSLPATVRREFDNSAANFCDFATDPENLDQMRAWGLAPPAKTPDAPVRVEVVSPPAAPPASPAGS